MPSCCPTSTSARSWTFACWRSRRSMPASLFRNARIVTPVDTGRASAGPVQSRTAAWERGALLCRGGRIVTVGDESAVLGALGADGRREIDEEQDCGGRCMIPGFVDAHTHLCFLAPREREFA